MSTTAPYEAYAPTAAEGPADLAGAACFFHMALLGGSHRIGRRIDIHDALAGEVWVVFAPGETDISGVYRAEFRVAYGDGRKETFPNSGYLSIQILGNLSKE